MDKIKRDAFLYMDPKGTKDFAQCSTCRSFLNGKNCALLGPNVKVYGDSSCGLYVHGTPGNDEFIEHLLTDKEVGLVHRKVRCENCVAFKADISGCDLYYQLNQKLPDMFDLDNKVDAHGCCNAQTAKDNAISENVSELMKKYVKLIDESEYTGPYRIPAYKEFLGKYGFKSHESHSNTTTVSEHPHGDLIIIHHGSTDWAHSDPSGDNEIASGKGFNKLKQYLDQSKFKPK